MPYEVIRDLRIAKPCHASWDEMKGDDRTRFCGQCGHNVYNFTGMSQDEVARHLREAEGRVCGRFYKRADGTLMTRNCPAGMGEPNIRRWPVLAAVVLLVSALGAAATRMGPREDHGYRPNPAIEKARTMPVVGPVVDWICPQPKILMGMLPMLPPTSSGPSGGP